MSPQAKPIGVSGVSGVNDVSDVRDVRDVRDISKDASDVSNVSNVSPRQRRAAAPRPWVWWLAGAAALAVAADHTLIVSPSEQAVVRVAPVPARNTGRPDVRSAAANRPAASDAADPLGLARLQQRADRDWAAGPLPHDPFAAATAARARAPAPTVATAPPSPATPPATPPFPYTYIGGWLEDGVRSAFLTRGDRVLWLRAGDTVDGRWRVDAIDTAVLRLTYLPSSEPVQLAVGAGS